MVAVEIATTTPNSTSREWFDMSSKSTARPESNSSWKTTLHGIHHLPHRMVTFIVTMHPVIWAGLFVVLPLAVLGSIALSALERPLHT